VDSDQSTEAIHHLENSIVRQVKVLPRINCSEERKELALRRIETLVHALRGTLNATQPVTDDGTL